jgi:hypothetical protein
MWEPDDAIIQQLKFLYFDQLPGALVGVEEEAERQELTARRAKIGHLLEHGYGEALVQNEYDPDINTSSSDLEGTAPVEAHVLPRRHRPLNPSRMSPIPAALRRASQALPATGSLDEGAKSYEIRLLRRRASQQDDRRAIEKLRLEYNTGIPASLSTSISDSERAKLLNRRENIRHLLERGYRVPLEGS